MCLFGCDNQNNKGLDEYIALNDSNCYYYLSIDDSQTKSENILAGGKHYFISYRKITISGAVNGLFSDCILTIEYGENKIQKDISLNASGFATFEYTINNSSYKAKIISCKGKIYL